MRKWSLFLMITAIAGMAMVSCSPDEEVVPAIKKRDKTEDPADNQISTDFSSNTFSSPTEAELLKELRLCDPAAPNDTDEKRPSCSPKFFRFFPLTSKSPLKDAFMVMVKAGVNNSPTRRLLIFERENGTLVKLNGFAGYLIERRPTASGYDDLLIRFGERVDGTLYFYNCLFTWQNRKYEYKLCEAINDSRIKAQFVDSMAVEIKSSLDKNGYLF